MAYADSLAIAGVSKLTVRRIISKLNITILTTYSDGDKDISDSDVPKLKIAIKIVEKDQTLLENVPKLKIAVHQELKKYAKKFYDDIPLNDKKDKFIMQQFDELLKQYDLQDYKNEIIRSNSETNLLETLKAENEKLKAENEKLKAELDLIEKDKLATAEIIKRIGEKYF
jgi:hypothetical protein